MTSSEVQFKSAGTPWPVRSSEMFTVESAAVGDTMAVGVWSPAEMVTSRNSNELAAAHGLGGPSDQFDVVYVLDGSWALGVASAICTLQLVDLLKPGFPPLLLVGVDYAVGAPNCRSRDYTMEDSVWPPMAAQLAAFPKLAPGGAPNFLRFLEEELDPFIRANYPVSDKPAGLIGDSFGGTFGTFAFLQGSPLFDRYWLGSPGIFTTPTDYAARFEDKVKGDLPHPTKMFLSFGSREANGGIDFYEDMGVNFNKMVSALNRNPNPALDWKAKVYPDHTHTTILAPAMNDALLWLYGPHLPAG